MRLDENLRENDLQHLVDTFISVDQYTSKLDEDNITVAFFCNEKEAAEDLKDFIEKMYFVEIRDIEVSDSLTEDNQYILYVEFERDGMFPDILIDIVDSVSYLTGNKKWTFESYETESEVELTEENVKKYIRTTKIEETKPTDVKEGKEITLENGWYKQQYLDEGFVPQEKMEAVINENDLNDVDPLEAQLFEHNFPGKEMIYSGSKVFVIGDKIQMFEHKDQLNEGFSEPCLNLDKLDKQKLKQNDFDKDCATYYYETHKKTIKMHLEELEKKIQVATPVSINFDALKREQKRLKDRLQQLEKQYKMEMKYYNGIEKAYLDKEKKKEKRIKQGEKYVRTWNKDMDDNENEENNYEPYDVNAEYNIDNSYKEMGDDGDLKRAVTQVLTTLPERSERIVRMYFGIKLPREYTQEEISKTLGISRTRVEQIIKKSLRMLRHPTRSRRLRAFLEDQ